MNGKLETCDCILYIDPVNHVYAFEAACSYHQSVHYTAEEVAMEHVALKMHKTRFNPIIRLRRLFH